MCHSRFSLLSCSAKQLKIPWKTHSGNLVSQNCGHPELRWGLCQSPLNFFLVLCQNSLMQEDETFRLLVFSIMQTVLIDRQPGASLYQLTPSLSKVRQLSWPKFMFPIIIFSLKCVNYLLQMCFITSTHVMSVSLAFMWNICLQLIHTEHQFSL